MAGLPIPGDVKKMLDSSLSNMSKMANTLETVVVLLTEIRDELRKKENA